MRTLLLAATLFFGPSPDYDRHELYQLVAMADRVVVGSITALHEKTFDLAVERDLTGGSGGSALTVKRFFNWTCAARWGEYRVGQRVVLFLRDDRAMGAGDEGDWPVLDGEALAPYRVHGLEQVTRACEGKDVAGTPLSLDELEQAIRGYRACFFVSRRPERGMADLELEYALNELAADEFERSGVLARHLVEETRSSAAIHGLAVSAVPAPLDVEPSIRAGGRWDSQFAESMTVVGDVDGDGWDDLAARGDDLGVLILFLGAEGEVVGRQRIDPAGFGIDQCFFGEGLTAAGDLDGNGVPDLVVGAPTMDEGVLGRAFLLLLDRDGSVEEARLLTGESIEGFGEPGFSCSLARLEGWDTRGSTTLLSMGDAKFVGIDALLRQLRGEEPPPHWMPLFRVDAGGVARRVGALQSADFVGTGSDVTFGRAMTSLGDLDGDGIAEIAIGHPFDSDGGQYRGAVWIAFLNEDGSLRKKTKISDWSGGFEASLMDEDQLGCALAAPGDLDGDGVPDLVVGGKQELWILSLNRDGTVARHRSYGHRAGGFVPVEILRTLAVLRGPAGALRLAVGGIHGGPNSKAAVLWVLELGKGGELSPIRAAGETR